MYKLKVINSKTNRLVLASNRSYPFVRSASDVEYANPPCRNPRLSNIVIAIYDMRIFKLFLSELMEEKSAEPVMDGVTFYVK